MNKEQDRKVFFYEDKEICYYNEACSNCGLPLDLHLGLNDPIRETPHSFWGDRNKCRSFKRCDPPKPAYGEAWWLED